MCVKCRIWQCGICHLTHLKLTQLERTQTRHAHRTNESPRCHSAMVIPLRRTMDDDKALVECAWTPSCCTIGLCDSITQPVRQTVTIALAFTQGNKRIKGAGASHGGREQTKRGSFRLTTRDTAHQPKRGLWRNHHHQWTGLLPRPQCLSNQRRNQKLKPCHEILLSVVTQ